MRTNGALCARMEMKLSASSKTAFLAPGSGNCPATDRLARAAGTPAVLRSWELGTKDQE